MSQQFVHSVQKWTIIIKDTKTFMSQQKLSFSIILDKLTDLGWEYTCNTMTRSGMQTYDELMQNIGVLQDGEHWNEDVYKDKCGDW